MDMDRGIQPKQNWEMRGVDCIVKATELETPEPF